MSTGPERRVGNIKIPLFSTQPNSFLKYFLGRGASLAPVKFFRIFQTSGYTTSISWLYTLGAFSIKDAFTSSALSLERPDLINLTLNASW